MENTPLFSIIVPVYNLENYLDKCIQSILNQTYKDFELILVDDGSKDNSGNICDKYKEADNRIKVIHKPNGGLVSARKAGAEIAVGEYIVCVDGDDWIAENYLERFETVIREYNPSVICCNLFIGTEEMYTVKKFHSEEKFYSRDDMERDIFPQLLYNETGLGISPNACSKAFLRDLYVPEQLAVSDKIILGEDMAVVKPCMFKADSVYTILDSLYFYRYNPASITKGGKAHKWDSLCMRIKHLQNRIDLTYGNLEEQMCKLVCHMFFNTACSQFHRAEKITVISKEIKNNLNNNLYKNYIWNSHFEKFDRKFMRFALKYKITELLWLYNKFKKQ